MHDNQIEDRLRSVLRKEGDDLTLNITAQELQRRLALRRRERAGRRVSLVAAGIAVVAIGGIVIAGNGWLGSGSAVGGKPVTSIASALTSPESARPSKSSPATPDVAKTADGGLGCNPVDPSASAAPPAVVAGAVPGDSIGYGGKVVASRWNGADEGTPGAWEGLPIEPDSISVTPGQALQITSDGCFKDVTAEALLTVYARVPVPSPSPIDLIVLRGVGSRTVDIEPPATGGWTVRIRATFLTADGSEAWSETLYRMFALFDAPRLRMSLGDAGQSIDATANCPNYQLASGASAEDLCGGAYEPIDGTGPLLLRKSVDLSLAGDWRIDQAKVTAVDAELVAAGKNAPEYSVAFVDRGGPLIHVPVALDPGTWIIRVSLNASRGGDTFGAWYDLLITVPR